VDPAKLDATHDGRVKTALAGGPVAVLVPGASHDPSASVRRPVGGSAGYLLVTPGAAARPAAKG
jgi:hypothetical protein